MDFGVNQGLVEELYSRYRENPRAVAESWRRFFDGMDEADRAELGAQSNGGYVNGSRTMVGISAPFVPATHGSNGNGNGARPAFVDELNGSAGPRVKLRPNDAETVSELQ